MTTAIAPVPWTAMNAELVTKAPAAGPTGIAGDQPRKRVHARQQPVRQPCRNALDTEHERSHGVALEGQAERGESAQAVSPRS